MKIERRLGEIAALTALGGASGRIMAQHNGVTVDLEADALCLLAQVDDAYQRMKGLLIHQPIATVGGQVVHDGLCVYDGPRARRPAGRVCSVSVFRSPDRGCHSHITLEITVEVLRILETKAVGYLANGLFRTRQLVFGQVDNLGLNVLLRRLARFFLHKIAEIVGRQVTFLREIFYRRQPFTQGTALPEVVVKQAFKLIKHVKIGRTAGDELPLIEAQTIVEQQFYVAADELSAVLVNGMVQLLLYLGKAIAEDGFLVFRQVQGLA